MIQSFRERLSGVIAIVLITLIAIPLAFFGVDSLFLSTTRLIDIGEVNGHAISELELARAVETRRAQIAQMLGENYNPDLIGGEQIRQAAVDSLIVQKLYLSAADDLDIQASDAQIGSQLLAMPQFEMDGQFSDLLFRNYLVQMGYTSASFMQAFGEDMTIRQLTASLLGSAFGTDQTVDRVLAVSQEKRSYQYIQLPVESVSDQVEVTEEEIQQYYQANLSEFAQPEMLSVNYVRLRKDTFIDQVEVTEEEIQQRFELLKASQPTQSEVAHILVEISEDDAHIGVLDSIQARIDSGEDFAAIAQQLSADVGSSANGGYLGFTDGSTFPFEFEQAVETLEEGAISAPVQTEAGFHIIKLLSVQRSSLELEAEYADLELGAKREKAEALYVEALEEFHEASLSTDHLTQLIDNMSSYVALDIETSAPFERDNGAGIADNAQVRAVSYGPIVFEDQLNSEVIELSEAEAIVVHFNEFFEAGTAPLTQVSEQIASGIEIAKANQLLASKVQALTAEIAAGAELEELARRDNFQWQVMPDQVRTGTDVIGRQMFNIALEGDFPMSGHIVQPEGGYIVYRLDSVAAGSIDDYGAGQKRQLRAQIGNQISAAEFEAYTATLRADADIDISIDVDLEI